MAQQQRETRDISNKNVDMQAGEMVERRASERLFLDEQNLAKVDLSVESPIGASLLKLALYPERHPNGLPGFHMDSITRLEEQSAKVSKGCSAEDLMKMMNNNTYLMQAAQMRVARLMQTTQRASLAPVVDRDQFRFS
jgi:hypothetical protein